MFSDSQVAVAKEAMKARPDIQLLMFWIVRRQLLTEDLDLVPGSFTGRGGTGRWQGSGAGGGETLAEWRCHHRDRFLLSLSIRSWFIFRERPATLFCSCRKAIFVKDLLLPGFSNYRVTEMGNLAPAS